jgi:hypothetical protein
MKEKASAHFARNDGGAAARGKGWRGPGDLGIDILGGGEHSLVRILAGLGLPGFGRMASRIV